MPDALGRPFPDEDEPRTVAVSTHSLALAAAEAWVAWEGRQVGTAVPGGLYIAMEALAARLVPGK